MIFRRFGTSYQSVEMDFDAKALNEIAFKRDREQSIPVADFEGQYETIETVELSVEAEGPVQYKALQDMLDKLRARVEELFGRLPDSGVLVVESQQGHDYPKPRQHTKNIIEEGENRLYFEYSMAPPLRMSLRQPKG